MSRVPQSTSLRKIEVARPKLRSGGSINKRALGLRTAARRRTSQPADNYGPRVMAGQFEPTAVRARTVAESRHMSLHALAASLGFADTPPKVRRSVDLDSLSRSELSKLTSYSLPDLNRFFRRKHPPTLSKLAKIAAAYGVWMDDLLTAVGW